MCLCVFMYFMSSILLRCKWPIGPFPFNKLNVSFRNSVESLLISRATTEKSAFYFSDPPF